MPIFIRMLHEKGLDYSLCEAEYDFGVIGTWSSLFVISKVFDLFDTAFVILRKQNLLFLHYYHHAASLIYSWYSLKDLCSTGRIFSTMNVAAHALMYPYYLCRLLRFNIPKYVMIFITTCQTLQVLTKQIIIIFWFGCFLKKIWFKWKKKDGRWRLCELLRVVKKESRRPLSCVLRKHILVTFYVFYFFCLVCKFFCQPLS